MPANLPPHYYVLEREFKAERDPRKKLELAQELIALMPKHKGTDKLQAEMKAKISKLKKQIDTGGKKHGASSVEDYTHIDREGAGQVIIIGPPNSGKSSIVVKLTNANPEVADYPFTTHKPTTGMMPYENIQIQLIDTPPISPDHTEKYIPELVRKADIVLITVDATSPGNLEEIEFIMDYFNEKQTEFEGAPEIEITEDRRRIKKARLIITRLDQPGGDGAVDVFHEFYGEKFPVSGLAVTTGEGVEEFKKDLFESLKIVRVYCKERGKEPDMVDPVILPLGGTVVDMALEIHKDFAHNLKHAKIWGENVHDGQLVAGDYQLNDGDIVELHI
ncbi:MAG: TGS domain-containing protein [candidate division Zixibacteria bacterium]|nr:TGS domain-containing protein [candidate division Zixibacteria bacterium]